MLLERKINNVFSRVKNYLDSKLLFCTFSVVFLFQNTNAQLTLNPTPNVTPLQLVQTIVGAGYKVSNVKMVAPNGSIGTFTNAGSNIGIPDGIILTTGNINVANGPNNSLSAGANNGAPGDNDLDNLSGATTFDGCAIEFDLVPACDSLIINYVFGSEEYPEYVNKQFNDVFAFFISGPGIVGTQNIALVPGTALPVSINNINAGANAQYFVNNAGGATIQYDGFTVPLSAKAKVIPCETYHLKIVIADVVDGIFDSGVFIQGRTIQCTPISYNDVATNVNAITNCANGSFTFCRTGPQTNPFVVHYSKGGTAVNGVDYVSIPDSVVIPAGQQCQTVNLIPIPQVGNPTVRTVKIIYQYGFCPEYDTITLTISDPPPVYAGPDVAICSGDSIQIGTVQLPGNTYSWTPTTGLSNPNIANPKISLVNNTNADQVIQYMLNVVDPNIGACVLKDSILVTVKPLPTAVISVGPDYCVGATVPFADSSKADINKNIASWYWTFGNSLFSTNQHPSIIYTTSGTFTVQLTVNDNTGCKHDTSQVINIWPSPIANFNASVPCQGDSVVFTNTSTVAAGGVIAQSIWNFGDGSPLVSTANPSHLYPTSANAYSVQLIVTSDKGCVGTIQKTITINPKPTAGFTAADVCLGAPTKFFNTSSGVNNFWTFGDGNTSVIRNPSHTYLAVGTYTVKLVTSTSFGCADSITKTVQVNDIPRFDFVAQDTTGCPVFCTTFNCFALPGSDSITSWLWMFNSGAVANSNQVVHCYTKPGTYSPTLIATSVNGCSDTISKPFYINVYPKPVANFTAYPSQLSSYDPTATITDLSSSDVTTWSWNFGDGTTSTNGTPPPHTFPNDKDEYLITLYVTNSYGCSDSTHKLIKIRQESAVYVPNAFTPNFDGHNESFRPYCSGIYVDAKYEMLIYDRWGNLLFRTKELNKGWDGTVNDRVCQQDVYVYTIAFWDKNDGTLLKRMRGTATLIK